MKYLLTKLSLLLRLRTIHRFTSIHQKIAFTGFLSFLLLSQNIFAQLNQVASIEIPKNNKTEETMTVLPLENDGLLLTLEKNGMYNRDGMQWTFQKYNTDFHLSWTTNFSMAYEYELQMSFQNKDYLFWLFSIPETPKINIVRIDLTRGEIDEFKGELPSIIDFSFFKVLSNTAFLGGVYFDKPIVASFSFFNQKAKVLHGLYDDRLEINALEIDEKRNELNVIVKERRKGKCGLLIQTYSYEGKSLRTIHVPDKEGNSLSFISGKMLTLNEKESLLVGNFSNNCNEFSKGLYLTRLEEGLEKNTNIIKFADLKNFFSFMSPKKQEKLKEKIEQKKKEGKDPNFSYKLLVHNLIETKNGAVLVAEIYYTLPKNYNNFNTVTRTRFKNYENKDDYRFTHAVICEFDKEGNLLWDNALVMDNLESAELVEQVQISSLQDRYLMAYFKKGKVQMQQIRKNEVLGEIETFEIKSDSTQKADEDANVAAWYNQHFLVWGKRKLEGNSRLDELPREVFYLRKLHYVPQKETKSQ